MIYIVIKGSLSVEHTVKEQSQLLWIYAVYRQLYIAGPRLFK